MTDTPSGGRDIAVFIPGWGSTSGLDWRTSPIRRNLRRLGYQPAIFVPPQWKGDIGTSGAAFADFLRQLKAPRVVAVGHSMGGLVARVADTMGADIEAVMTMGTPHEGSPAAPLLSVTLSGRQMRAGSPFLSHLSAQPHRARYLAVGGRFDVITHNAFWDQAERAVVNSGHVDMVWSIGAARLAARFFGPTQHLSSEPVRDEPTGTVAPDGTSRLSNSSADTSALDSSLGLN